MTNKLIILLFLVCIYASAQEYGQDTILYNHKPGEAKIGLVLSGGGAKCFSQIGALKVIEEAGVQLDYIAGTSMGAIIGGLYALGYSANEIEVYMKAIDWNRLLTNDVPRNRLSYQDRKSYDRYLISLPVSKWKVSMPAGLNYAQYILTQLSFLTQKSYQYSSFSEFPTPFLCVGTNLITGELEVFKEGRLLDAMRASSSFPSLYVPYEIDDKLYVDGGVINNYPIVPLLDEAKLDYVIGIDLQNFLYEKEQIETAAQVLEQTSSFINARVEFDMIKYTDLLMEPELPEGSNITSFELMDSIIAAGEASARQHWEGLKYLAAMQKKRSIDSSRLKADVIPPKNIFVDSISFEGNQTLSRDFLMGKLRFNQKQSITKEKLELGIDQLYGSKYLSNISYHLYPADSGYHIYFKLDETEEHSKVKLGLHYDDDYKSAFLVNFTTRDFLFKNSRLSLDFAFGDNSRFKANYFIDRGLIPSVGFNIRSNRFEFRTYENFEPTNLRSYVDVSNEIFVQSTAKDAYALGGAIDLDYVHIEQEINPQEIEGVDEWYLSYIGYIDFDSFDDKDFPKHGSQLFGSYRVISSRSGIDEQLFEPSSLIDVSYKQTVRFGPKLTLLPSARGIATIGPSPEAPYLIYLGSIGNNFINYHIPFAGYRFRELSGTNTLTARFDLHYEFSNNQYITGTANFGRIENSFRELFEVDYVLDGYSLGYSYDSPIGPLSLNIMGSTNHDNMYTYLSLGFWF